MKNKLLFNFTILLVMALVQVSTFFLPRNLNTIYFAAIRPVTYLVLVTLTLLVIGINFGFNKKKDTATLVLIFGVVLYVGMLFFVGFFENFGRNPMLPSWTRFFINLWHYVPFVICSEVIRYQIIKNTDTKYRPLMIFAVVLVFSFVMMENLNNAQFFNRVGQVDYLMTTMLPIVVINFFLTYICTSGSLTGIILFRAAFSLIPVLVPILPNITPILLSILIYVDVFIMFILYDKFVYDSANKERRRLKSYSWRGYIIPGLLLVMLVTFGFGILPIMPVAVASNSMKGSFARGDIVIVKKLDTAHAEKTLQIGDIIQYKSNNIEIIHRIVGVTVDYNGNIQYVTKGDNNESSDLLPVKPSQVVGVAKNTIPVLGYPAVWLTEFIRS